MAGDSRQGQREEECRRVCLLGIPVAVADIDGVAARIEAWVADGGRRYVTVTGVHGLMEAQEDAEIRRCHRQADLCVPDGMPLVWMGRLLGERQMHRVYGPDLMLELCRRSEKTGATHFLYGGRPDVLERLRERLSSRFPASRIVGACSPPFRPMTPHEEEDLQATIRRLRPDIVWVGLGTPKQEKWMAAHVGRLDARVLIGVGAAFDIHAGVLPQAPRWMRAGGLEWLFRLLMEPRRLWRRYLKNNPRFVVAAAKQFWRSRPSTAPGRTDGS